MVRKTTALALILNLNSGLGRQSNRTLTQSNLTILNRRKRSAEGEPSALALRVSSETFLNYRNLVKVIVKEDPLDPIPYTNPYPLIRPCILHFVVGFNSEFELWLV